MLLIVLSTDRGYKSHILFNHVFHLEDRWTNLRELGQGAYGLVISAQDNLRRAAMSGSMHEVKLMFCGLEQRGDNSDQAFDASV